MHLTGLPIARLLAGTSAVTLLPAEITEPDPMVTPGSMLAPCAIHTSEPMTTGPVRSPVRSETRTKEPNWQRSPIVTERETVTDTP